MNDVLKKSVDTVVDRPVLFEVVVDSPTRTQQFLAKIRLFKGKRTFALKPLTLAQLQKISGLLLSLDAGKLTANDILKLMNGVDSVVQIIAIAVTPSRNEPSEDLLLFLKHNLKDQEMTKLLNIILDKMNVLSFITSILSIRNLNILDRSPETKSEIIADQTHGNLSVAS